MLSKRSKKEWFFFFFNYRELSRTRNGKDQEKSNLQEELRNPKNANSHSLTGEVVFLPLSPNWQHSPGSRVQSWDTTSSFQGCKKVRIVEMFSYVALSAQDQLDVILSPTCGSCSAPAWGGKHPPGEESTKDSHGAINCFQGASHQAVSKLLYVATRRPLMIWSPISLPCSFFLSIPCSVMFGFLCFKPRSHLLPSFSFFGMNPAENWG